MNSNEETNKEKPKNFKKTLKKLLKEMKPYYFYIILIIIFSILGTMFTIVGPSILGEATTELYTGLINKINGLGSIDFSKLYKILFTMLIMYILSAIFNYIQGFVMANISQKYTKKLRTKVYKKLHKLPLKYFDNKKDGEVLSLITNDIDTINGILSEVATELITCLVMVIGILIMMFKIDLFLTIISLLLLPLSLILCSLFVGKSQKHFTNQQNLLASVNGCVEEMLSGHTIIKTNNAEEKILNDFKKENESLSLAVWKSTFLSSIMSPIMSLIGNLGYVLVAILGGLNVIKGKMTVGEIQAFITYTKNFTSPIGELASITGELQSMIAASERVFAFLLEQEEIEPTTEINLNNIKGNVEFKNIKFGYNENKIIINGFNAKIDAGKKIAIVGPTGAGKTTIVKLLMRFYELNSGEILIDGINIKDVKRETLRKEIGMVLQETWLFNGTIMDNIRYGRANATEEEIIKSCELAFADDFIKTLPNTYNMILDEETGNISSGQKQLLTIARAILKNPKILILDEATSNVDTRTEELIQKAMDKLMENRTSFIIAHRLSTIKNADLILVLKDGDIIEQGTHENLLKQNGFYSSLYNSQFDKI